MTDTATLRADLAAMERRAQEAEATAHAQVVMNNKLYREREEIIAELRAAEAKLALLDSPALLEALAAYEHNYHWSGWEQYRAQKSGQIHPSGETYEARWLRQRNTWYADLPEAQRESDREEVRHYLAVIRGFMEKGNNDG